MTHTTAIHVDADSERSTPLPVETHEIRYLDMSGDGLPDAVEYIDRRLFRRRDGSLNTVEEKRRLSYGIGIDGKPAGVTRREATFVRDGTGRLRRVMVPDHR
jgi:hypothetical protein